MVTIKVEHNAIYWVSIILTVLFAWLIFPYKWVSRAVFRHRRSAAMRRARRMSETTGKVIYVVQWHDTFFVGRRDEMRQLINQHYGRRVRRRYSHQLTVDYRNAVIASFQNGVKMEVGCDNGAEQRV